MFHHIVMLNFKEPLQQSDQDYIVGVCEEMKRDLPGILSIEFVSNVSNRSPAYTHAFVTAFIDEAAHDHYQTAPLHVPLKQKVVELIDNLVVLDYRI